MKASSCTAVAPASRMWYPLTEIVFQRGTSFAQNAKMSVISRIDGRGGKMYSFCAMNSLRMSFWIVPDSFCQSAPCFSATTRYIAKIIAAGELIVIDVVMSASEMPSNSVSMSASDATLTPHFPTSPSDSSWSGSRPISVGRSKATLRPVPPAREQRLVALVGVFRRPEPGELPHRPELAAVAGGMDAAGVREHARDPRCRAR